MNEPTTDELFYQTLRAIRKHNLPYFQELIKQGQLDPHLAEASLRAACESGSLSIVELLLDYGADPALYQSQSLISACPSNNAKIIEKLIAAGADPHEANGQALIIAAKHKAQHIVKYLVERANIHPSTHNNEALVRALFNDDAPIITFLATHPKTNLALGDFYVFKSFEGRTGASYEEYFILLVKALLEKPLEPRPFINLFERFCSFRSYFQTDTYTKAFHQLNLSPAKQNMLAHLKFTNQNAQSIASTAIYKAFTGYQTYLIEKLQLESIVDTKNINQTDSLPKNPSL